jgi:hypothetical protein
LAQTTFQMRSYGRLHTRLTTDRSRNRSNTQAHTKPQVHSRPWAGITPPLSKAVHQVTRFNAVDDSAENISHFRLKTSFSKYNRELICAKMASPMAEQTLRSHDSLSDLRALFHTPKRYQTPLNEIITRICPR